MKNRIKYLFSSITGESIIPLNLYIIQSPLIVIFTVMGDPEFRDFNNLVKQFQAALLSVLVTFFLVIFFKYIIFAPYKKNTIPLFQIILFIILLGLVKGGSTYFFTVQFGLHDHGFFHWHPVIKILSAVVVAFWFVPTTSWIFNSIKKFQNMRNDLMMQSIKLKLENLSYKKLIEESKLTLKNDIEEIFSDIKIKLDEIEENKTFENEWPKIADLVRNVAINRVRPKSHQLWEQPTQYKEKLSIWYFIKSAIHLNPFPWKIVIPIFSMTSFLSMYLNYGYNSLELLFFVALIILVMYATGNFIIKSMGKFTLFVYITILSLTSILLVLNLNIVLENRNFNLSLAFDFFGILWLIILTFFSSLVTTVRLSQENLIKEVETSLNQQKIHKATLSQLEKRINTKLAKFLHGYVQARLMSNALRLENADKDQDVSLATQEIDKLTKDLSQNFGVLEQFDSESTFADELEKIKKSWFGICDVEIMGYKNLKVDEMIIKDFLVDAISEAVANSVRHGAADQVQVIFNQVDQTLLELSIKDNGTGGSLSNNSGLGTEIFNLLCGNNWNLMKNPEGLGSLLVLKVDTSLDQDVIGRL
jgi:signal transduction histidine kinase